jgi:hypothetical protein
MAELERPTHTAPGRIEVLSPPGVVEVLPGYQGPRTAADLGYEPPQRVWTPIGRDGRPEIAFPDLPTQVDGRSYTVDQIWSGLRFIFKVDALNVAFGFSYQNLFTTHLGRTFNGKPHWTEVGVIRTSDDPVYRLFTFTQNQIDENGTWGYFGTTQPGDVFEFVIRLDETDPGPYRYETLCNGRRVRQGIMPVLDNQVDVSSETWTHGVVSGGDYVMAVEGWVNYPPRHARWYAPDLDIRFYSTDPRHKTVSLDRPPAYKFSSAT